MAENLLNYVPGKADTIISVNVNDVLKLPFVNEAKKDKKYSVHYNKVKNELGKHQLKVEDIAKRAVIFKLKGNNAGIVFTTGIPQATLKELLVSDMIDKGGVKFVEKTIKGRKVIVTENPVNLENIPANQMSIDKESVITYLKKDVVLMTEKDCFEEILDSLDKANITSNKELMAWKNAIDTNAVFWSVFSVASDNIATDKKDDKQQVLANPRENIRGGSLSVNFCGKNMKDLAVDITVECDTEQSASMMAMQAQGMIMMASGSFFQSAPQLGVRLGNSIKIEPAGKKISGKINLSEELIDELQEYSKKKAVMPATPHCPLTEKNVKEEKPVKK
jgi:hypothetical protein